MYRQIAPLPVCGVGEAIEQTGVRRLTRSNTAMRLVGPGFALAPGMNGAPDTAATSTQYSNASSCTTVGPYRLMEHIGEGGWATVHKVTHIRSGRAYAMKRARTDAPASTADVVRLMINEVQIARKAQHGGVIEMVDIGVEPDGRAYLVMELLSGECLLDIVTGDDYVAPGYAALVASQVASALAAVHASGAVHRDVSPGNIFIEHSADGDHAKLIDFGSACSEYGVDINALSEEGMISGTPLYVSPEQARGALMDARSDIYSLGVILYELIAGKPPFVGSTAAGVLLQHIHVAPPALHSEHAAVPASLVAVVLRCLEKQPSARFQSADEVVAALHAVDWDEQQPVRSSSAA